MKKVTFLTCVLALCTSTMFAQTLEVTTADMDPVAAGGLVYVIEHAESGSVIEFNFDGEVLDYGEGTGIAIKGKTLTFNGINKKNGKRVTIKGLESLFTVGEASVISLNKVTTKKRNAERYSDRIELQGFQSCFRLFVKPSQSPLKPNQDAATLLVRNHARNGDKRTRITKQGVKD